MDALRRRIQALRSGLATGTEKSGHAALESHPVVASEQVSPLSPPVCSVLFRSTVILPLFAFSFGTPLCYLLAPLSTPLPLPAHSPTLSPPSPLLQSSLAATRAPTRVPSADASPDASSAAGQPSLPLDDDVDMGSPEVAKEPVVRLNA